jgi:hypothetical protein
MNNKHKKLILLTSEFPYGDGETFIENEFQFLTAGGALQNYSQGTANSTTVYSYTNTPR